MKTPKTPTKLRTLPKKKFPAKPQNSRQTLNSVKNQNSRQTSKSFFLLKLSDSKLQNLFFKKDICELRKIYL